MYTTRQANINNASLKKKKTFETESLYVAQADCTAPTPGLQFIITEK